MSHVVDMGMPITEVNLLIEAAAEIGMEVRHKTNFHWFGQHVGDYPLPAGFTKEDMGKCEFALGVKGKPEAYEIGVCKRRDGKDGYALLFDFWAGGYGLMEAIGENGGKLKQAYNVAAQIKEARRQGYRVHTTVTATGHKEITVKA